MNFPYFEVDEIAREASNALRSSRRSHETAVDLEVPLYHVEYEITNLTQAQNESPQP
jgi:hypothetical protein